MEYGPNQSYGIFKVGQNKWIQKLYNGTVSFSCAKAYILQGKYGGNDEQGDVDEAVFARLRNDDVRIAEMQAQLGCDLEIIKDESYVKLRRKSSCLIPIFCCYTIKYDDFIGQVSKVGKNEIRIDIPDKIYTGFLGKTECTNVFSSDCRVMGIFFQPAPFFERVETALRAKNHAFRRRAVDYQYRGKEEFFITPTDSRDELFYKHPKYSYQHEERIILYRDMLDRFLDRLDICIGPADDDRCLMPNPFYITTNVWASKKR